MKPGRIGFLFVIALCGALLVVYGKDWVSGRAELSFKVLDDNGLPVNHAQVRGYFWSPYTANAVGDQFKLTTDANGICIIAGKGYNEINGVVKADGHYQTEFSISLGDKNKIKALGVWPLKNPTVILKAIRNPIPMYAKKLEIEIPKQNTPLGFDMEKDDWVAPYGSGVIADFFILYSLEKQDLWTGIEHFEISNTSLKCGVQEMNADMYSKFKSVYEAPMTGYTNALKYVLNRTKTKIIEQRELEKSRYIVFRSRVVLDEEGNLKRAHYGKLYPPIRHGQIKGKNNMEFTYYFNPTPNDRNLEFNPKKNLFKNQMSFEQVHQP